MIGSSIACLVIFAIIYVFGDARTRMGFAYASIILSAFMAWWCFPSWVGTILYSIWGLVCVFFLILYLDDVKKKTTSRKNRMSAVFLSILLGTFGIHKNYLHNYGLGAVYLLFAWTGIPTLIGIIDGLVLLSMSDEDFDAKYNKKDSEDLSQNIPVDENRVSNLAVEKEEIGTEETFNFSDVKVSGCKVRAQGKKENHKIYVTVDGIEFEFHSQGRKMTYESFGENN